MKFTSHVFAQASGSVGGMVYSHNTGGQYAKISAVPTNPQTPAQSAARGNFGGNSALYRALLPAEQQSWINYGQSSPRVDAIGNVHPISGVAAFISTQRNLNTAGGAATTIAPAPVGSDAIITVAVAAVAGAGTVIVTVDPDPVPADHTMVFQSTIPVSAGVNNLNSLYRQIGTEVATTAGPFDMSAEWIAKYGSLIAGMKIGMRVYLINSITGEVSVGVSAQTIIT